MGNVGNEGCYVGERKCGGVVVEKGVVVDVFSWEGGMERWGRAETVERAGMSRDSAWFTSLLLSSAGFFCT